MRLPRLSKLMNVELWCKRDDLFPFVGGGNKARKIVEICRDIGRSHGIITTGGAQSNHARATALLAAQNGWKCKLVLHGDPLEMHRPRGNLLLMMLAGADIKIVRPDFIERTVFRAREELLAEGLTPFEIPGGGHCDEGTLAYVKAVRELARQCRKADWLPDYIVHASGTGTTQAGILFGIERMQWATKVIGISIAREKANGGEIVRKAYEDIRRRFNHHTAGRPVVFLDEWTAGGYEKIDDTVIATLRFAAEAEGLILDPTYTGKAFTALVDLIRSGEIPAGARVLFWHTGGLLNLMASKYSIAEGDAA